MNNCEHCGVRLKRGRFCSLQCVGLSRRQDIEPEVLMPFVETGTTMTRIATELHVTREFVRNVMRRRGVYRAWCESRYKKCAVAA